MKYVKISEETAARIRNLLTHIKESEDKGGEPSPDTKEEATKLAAHMRESGMIKAADEQAFAETLSTHDGALRVARRGVDLEVEHLKNADSEKQAEAKQVPALGGGRRDYTPDSSSKDRMKEASDNFADTVLSAAGKA